MQYGGTVYILANEYGSVLYIGVTSDLFTRIPEHKNKIYPTQLQQNTIAISLFIMKPMHE